MSNAVLVGRDAERAVIESAYAVRPKSQSSLVRGQRLGLTLGGLALGAIIGFTVAMSIGRADVALSGIGATAFALSFPLAIWSVRQCVREHAYGCAALSVLHLACLIGWLGLSVGAYVPPLGVSLPAIASLVFFASCWTRSDGGVYRTSFQALVLGIAASAQFMFLAFGA